MDKSKGEGNLSDKDLPAEGKKSSTRRRYLIVVIVVCFVGMVAILLVSLTKDESPKAKSTKIEQPKKQYMVKKACDILSLSEAKKLFASEDVVISTEDNSDSNESPDVATSSCSYITNPSSQKNQSLKTATILVRSAKTETGADSNSKQFTLRRPVDTQDVSGYGDGAYWNIQLGQLNILKGNTWYVLSYGPPMINQKTLAQTQQLANAIQGKLDYAPDQNY